MEQMKYLSRDEYEAILQEQYTALESNDIIHLINQSKKNLIEIIDKDNRVLNSKTEFIASIITHATQYRKLSFKQWKALKAFNNEYLKDISDVKTF
jgi:hypothetical protein